jgi:hypothetical protein
MKRVGTIAVRKIKTASTISVHRKTTFSQKYQYSKKARERERVQKEIPVPHERIQEAMPARTSSVRNITTVRKNSAK